MRFNIFNLFKKPKREVPSQHIDTTISDPEVEKPIPPPAAEVKLEPPQTAETTNLRIIIEAIIQKHKAYGIEVNKPATSSAIDRFEQQIGFSLPTDFKEFYSICNGFGCTEDIFNMTPIEEVVMYDENFGKKWFHFAEYMIYCDMWGLRQTAEGKFEIFNGSYPLTAMTSSLEEFLNRFLKGDVFEEGGLYRWQEELGIGR